MATHAPVHGRNARVDDDPIPEGATASAESGAGAFCSCAACQSWSEVRLTNPIPNVVARYVTGTDFANATGLATAEEMARQLRREVNDIWLAVAGIVAFLAFVVIIARTK